MTSRIGQPAEMPARQPGEERDVGQHLEVVARERTVGPAAPRGRTAPHAALRDRAWTTWVSPSNASSATEPPHDARSLPDGDPAAAPVNAGQPRGLLGYLRSHARAPGAAAERAILVLDGAYGTASRPEPDRRRLPWRAPGPPSRGDRDPDVLNLTRPDVDGDPPRLPDRRGHIVTTNTFTATAIAQADYGLESVVQLNRAGAAIARRAADGFGPDRFVAGSVGPTNQTLSPRRA